MPDIPSGPATTHVAITPNDGVDIDNNIRSLYVTASGDLVVQDAKEVNVTYPVTVGQVFTFAQIKRVFATGTTASVVGWR